MLCEDLGGWDGGGVGGRLKRGETMDTELIHFTVERKPTQHCKAAIPQLKKKYRNV